MKYIKKFENLSTIEKRYIIEDIMKIVKEDDCNIVNNITSRESTITEVYYRIKYYDDGDVYINYLDSRDRRRNEIILMFDYSAVDKIYDYLTKKYEYVLSGKDMGLL